MEEHNNKRIKRMESSTVNKKKIGKQPRYFSTRRKRYTAGTLKNQKTEENYESTDMELIDSPRRTPTPPLLSACEQILQNKAHLCKRWRHSRSSNWPASQN
ncbi:hypothetical protein TNCV_4661791 [Trichonephila clavipes]|uniref:Uncharacterized protein n=1 Tax=Trichonephila clavipes TaxID=2585209 RepID=A0A8X6SL85_TRICX|nr:hypothetical protein TNCV_4661791 [Trichonephila clavipes]